VRPDEGGGGPAGSLSSVGPVPDMLGVLTLICPETTLSGLAINRRRRHGEPVRPRGARRTAI